MKRQERLAYAIVALSFAAVLWVHLVVYPKYYFEGLLAVPFVLSAFLLPSRHTVIVIVLILIVAAATSTRESNPIPITTGRVGALVITGVLAYFLNTQRERAERQLAEVRRKAAELETIISSVGVGIIIHGPDGQFVRMNEDARRMLNPPPGFEDLPLERRMAESRVEDAQGRRLEFDQLATSRALHGETVRGLIESIQLPGAIKVWVSASSSPITIDGQLAGTVLALTDISELRKLNDLAERRSADLHGIISNMIDAVLVCNDKGQVTLTNQAGTRLFGIKQPADGTTSLDSLYGTYRIRNLEGTPVSVEQSPLARALDGEVVDQEICVIRSQESYEDVFIRTSAAPIRNAAGRIVGAVAVSRDMTELVQADRMKDDFIKVAAHELKTPVAIVKGYAQAFNRIEQARPEQRNRMLTAIDEGANRISMIIDDLLEISQLQIGRLKLRIEQMDLLQAVQKVMNQMALRSPSHQFRLVKADPAIVNGDCDRLEEVVHHLIRNSVKFSPKGGPIDIAVERTHDAVVVSVRDYGIGIPTDKQRHIFERFYRAHAGMQHDYGGMGVGLYISRELIQLHGGRIWFQSGDSEGSTFFFSLPIRGQNDGE